MMTCPYCKVENASDAKYCSQCGKCILATDDTGNSSNQEIGDAGEAFYGSVRLLKQGNPDEALSLLKRAVDVAKNKEEKAAIYYNMAVANQRLENHDRAINSLFYSIQLRPELARKARKDSDLSEIYYCDEFKNLLSNQELSGIGGWLLIPAISLAIVPFIRLVGIVQAANLYPKISRAGYGGIYALHMITEVAICGLIVYAAVLFFRKLGNAPQTIILLLHVGYIAPMALGMVSVLAGAELFAAANIKGFVLSIIPAAIWIPYFKKSKRVFATFVN